MEAIQNPSTGEWVLKCYIERTEYLVRKKNLGFTPQHGCISKNFCQPKEADTKGRYWMISFLWHQILLKVIYIRYWGRADWWEMGAMELSGLMHMFYFLVSRDNVLPWCYMGVDNCQHPSSCPPDMCAFYCMLIYL